MNLKSKQLCKMLNLVLFNVFYFNTSIKFSQTWVYKNNLFSEFEFFLKINNSFKQSITQ